MEKSIVLKKEQRLGRKAHKQVKRDLLFGLVTLLIFTAIPNSAANPKCPQGYTKK